MDNSEFSVAPAKGSTEAPPPNNPDSFAQAQEERQNEQLSGQHQSRAEQLTATHDQALEQDFEAEICSANRYFAIKVAGLSKKESKTWLLKELQREHRVSTILWAERRTTRHLLDLAAKVEQHLENNSECDETLATSLSLLCEELQRRSVAESEVQVHVDDLEKLVQDAQKQVLELQLAVDDKEKLLQQLHLPPNSLQCQLAKVLQKLEHQKLKCRIIQQQKEDYDYGYPALGVCARECSVSLVKVEEKYKECSMRLIEAEKEAVNLREQMEQLRSTSQLSRKFDATRAAKQKQAIERLQSSCFEAQQKIARLEQEKKTAEQHAAEHQAALVQNQCDVDKMMQDSECKVAALQCKLADVHQELQHLKESADRPSARENGLESQNQAASSLIAANAGLREELHTSEQQRNRLRTDLQEVWAATLFLLEEKRRLTAELEQYWAADDPLQRKGQKKQKAKKRRTSLEKA